MSQEGWKGHVGEEKKGKSIWKRKKEEENGYRRKLLFWNVAELDNKGKDFWKYLKGFDFISKT